MRIAVLLLALGCAHTPVAVMEPAPAAAEEPEPPTYWECQNYCNNHFGKRTTGTRGKECLCGEWDV